MPSERRSLDAVPMPSERRSLDAVPMSSERRSLDAVQKITPALPPRTSGTAVPAFDENVRIEDLLKQVASGAVSLSPSPTIRAATTLRLPGDSTLPALASQQPRIRSAIADNRQDIAEKASLLKDADPDAGRTSL